MKTSHDVQPSPTLQALCQQAGAQASGGRLRVEAAPREGRGLRRVWIVGLVMCTLAVAAAQFIGTPNSEATAAGLAAAQSLPPAFARMPATAIAVPDKPEPVRRQGDDLLIALDEVPLPRAISLLAHATQTTVIGLERLQQPAPITLHWRIANRTTMWNYLLQNRAVFSLRCDGAACVLSIHREIAAPAPAATQAAVPVKPPQTASEREVAESQPDGSC